MSPPGGARRQPAWRRYLAFWGNNTEADVDEELRFHLLMRAEEYAARGLAPDAARQRAEQRFGSMDQARDACVAIDRQDARSETTMQMLASLAQDTAYAFRVLRRQRVPALAAILCMALGVGATTGMFSIATTLLLRPLPYPNGDRLVAINTARKGAERGSVSSLPDYLDWRARQHSFDEMAAMKQSNAVLLHGQPQRIAAAAVTSSFFPTFGIAAELGRVIGPEDDTPGAPPVMMLSDAFAREEFGDPARALGKSAIVNGVSRAIIGIVPDEWRYPSRGQLWMPMATSSAAHLEDPDARGQRSFEVFAVLRRGTTLDAARRDMSSISEQLAVEHPRFDADNAAVLLALRDRIVGDVRGSLFLVIAATLLVLLIACANIAALQLARSAARAREIAVRAAIGATRARIVRQLLTENVVLALAGGALGVVLAVWARELIQRAVAPTTPAWMTFDLDWRALLFAFLVSAVAGVAFGVAPALRLAGARTGTALRNATVGWTRSRLQRGFVAAEVAISITLVVAASFALESVSRIQRIPLGMNTDSVATFSITFQSGRYDEATARAQLVADIERRLRALPGVVAVGATDLLPINGGRSQFGARIEGHPVPEGHEPYITGNMVTPGYFDALRVRLLAGRTFTDADNASAPPVTIVNKTFADTYWPRGDALGHHLDTGAGDARIVGVVQDVKQSSVFGAPEPQFFRPYAADPWPRASFVIRARGDLGAVAADARRVVRQLDPTMPIFGVQTLRDAFDEQTLTTRSLSRVLVAFAAIALVLAAAGLYGLISFLVERRTRELGLRVALGARPASVAGMVMRQACVLAAIGAVVGLAGAAVGARWLTATLYGVSAGEPSIYLAAAGILAIAAVGASYGPARRASRADPMDALRSD
jgi:predicted permease